MHAGLIEFNCETDFVAKSSLFCELVQKTANTSVLFSSPQSDNLISPIDITSLLSRSLVDGDGSTVQEATINIIGKLGENIKPRRGLVAHQDSQSAIVFGAYAHSAGQIVPAGLGRVASIVALKAPGIDIPNRLKLVPVANKIAQHISGFAPECISLTEGIQEEATLLEQQFIFGGGSVKDVLESFSSSHQIDIQIIEMARWTCGDGLKKEESNFAAEVAQQIASIEK
jgi:elongation factor Ts